MPAPREIELKLECDGPDLTALAAHPLLQGEGTAATHLHARYYDTAERTLRAAGLTLRVRRESEDGEETARHVQTVKAIAASAGLFDRPEWERAVAGLEPERAALDGTPAGDALAAAGEPSLVPLFTTRIERTQRTIAYGAATIAVALDLGRIETPEGDAPVCEAEFELEEGAAGDLFALAQALSETVPLRLGALTKSERGEAAAQGRLMRPSKAEAVRLTPDITAGEAFVRIARACLRHLRLNEAVLLHRRDDEALHQVRVALRRLRSAFTLFRPLLDGDAAADTLRDEIRRVTEPFGRARNLDVFLGETLAAERMRRPDEAGLADLHARVSRERERAYDAVLSILRSQEWRGLLIDLVAWIETGPWRGAAGTPERDGPARSYAAGVLERLRRRIEKRGRHLARLDPEERHAVRIAAKKLRYGAEFFAGVFADDGKARRRHKAFVAALSDLQDQLGALNDIATAHAIGADLPPGEGRDAAARFSAGLVAADAEARSNALLKAAASARKRLVETRPFWR